MGTEMLLSDACTHENEVRFPLTNIDIVAPFKTLSADKPDDELSTGTVRILHNQIYSADVPLANSTHLETISADSV